MKWSCVYDRELNAYFHTLYGYVFTAFVLLVGGIYTAAVCLQGGSAAFERVVGSMTFIFIIVIPILTMRTFAEERRQKTEQLLYALPVTMGQVVLGKFLALITVIAIPVLILTLYPLALSFIGPVDLRAAFCALIGFYVLGAALGAIGMFLSAQVDSQAVAAGLSFVVTLVLFFLSNLADLLSDSPLASAGILALLLLAAAWQVKRLTRSGSLALAVGAVLEAGLLGSFFLWPRRFAGLVPRLLRRLSLFERYYVFLDGIFDWTALVYLVSAAGMFLLLTAISLEKRRWNG